MSETSFSVTEVVTAVRCGRQLVLLKKGMRVVPYGADAFGTAAHVALAAVADGARTDERLHALLDIPMPDRGAVVQALFRLALGGAQAHAKKVASRVDGGDLSRFADSVLRLATMLAQPLTRMSAEASSGKEAVHSAFLASEEEVAFTAGDFTIRGRIDLMCRDAAETWLWDLKTYTGTHDAELEQVRLYAMAYGATQKRLRPALVHVTHDRIEVRNADPVKDGDIEQVGRLARLMSVWLDGAPPPPATDLGTCRTCPARGECWRTWGRTLPDENDEIRPPTVPPPAMASLMGDTKEPLPTPKNPVSPAQQTPVETPRQTPVGATLQMPRGLTLQAPVGPQTTPSRASVPRPGSPPPKLVPTPEASAPAAPTGPKPLGSSVDAIAPLFLGFDPKKNAVCIEPLDLTRHVAVFGASGSGKTYFAKSIVEEAILAGIPVIAFDVQGDILTLARTRGDADLDTSLHSRRDRYAERAEVRLLTPLNDAGLRVAMNPMKFPAGELTPERRAICAEAIADNLLAFGKTPPATREHVRMFLAKRIEAAMSAGSTLTISALIAGIVADEDEEDDLLEAKARAKLVKDLKLLTMGTKSYTFREGRPFDLDDLVTPKVSGKVPLNVLWLNGLGDQESKESFVAMVLANIYTWMLGQRGGEPRVLLYFDEIGPYMPPSREPPTKKLLKRIFKEGRKYGVCGLFCTQNFTDVDYKVVSQANTICIGRVNAAQEKRKAIEAFGAPPDFDVAAAVTNLIGGPQGRFLIKQASGKVGWVQGRHLTTEHGTVWGEDEIRNATPDDVRRAWNETK